MFNSKAGRDSFKPPETDDRSPGRLVKEMAHTIILNEVP